MSCHAEMSGGSSFVVSPALRIVMLFSGASARRTSVGPPAWGALPLPYGIVPRREPRF